MLDIVQNILAPLGKLFAPPGVPSWLRAWHQVIMIEIVDVKERSLKLWEHDSRFLFLAETSTHNAATPGSSPAGGQWCPAPHFTFGPLVAAYIQYSVLKMWPPSGFCPPAAKSWRRACATPNNSMSAALITSVEVLGVGRLHTQS